MMASGASARRLESDAERAAANDMAAQQGFTSLIETANADQAISLPYLPDFLDHYGDTSRISYLFEGEGNRLFTGPRFDEVIASDGFPDEMSFAMYPMLRMGRENSRRAVFFGNLISYWEEPAQRTSVAIAVKPITAAESSELRHDYGLHEAAMYQYLGQLGLNTLEVLGIGFMEQPVGDSDGFLVTRFNRKFASLDSLQSPEMTEAERWQQVDPVLETHAVENALLVFNGDGEFRNIGVDEAGNLVFFDLEKSTSLRYAFEDVDLIADHMSLDLNIICMSIQKHIINLVPNANMYKDELALFELLRAKVYEPYFARLLLQNSPYIDVLTKAYEIALQKREANAHGIF